MSRFGSDLLLTFLSKAWPNFRNSPIEYVTYKDLAEMFFNTASMIRQVAVDGGNSWTPSAPALLDDWLASVARSGVFEGDLKVPSDAGEELWRRWQSAIVACELEATEREALDVPFPADAPEAIRSGAAVLYIIGGPAREYPAEMFTR